MFLKFETLIYHITQKKFLKFEAGTEHAVVKLRFPNVII